MIDVNGGYSFSRSGSWPLEQYKLTFLEFNTSKTNNLPFFRQSKPTFRYFYNPIAGIDKLLFDYQVPSVYYFNCGLDLYSSELYQLSSNSTPESHLTWAPSSLRIYDTGYIFNYNSIQNINNRTFSTRIKEQQANITLNDNIKNYSYLLLPNKLVLRPTNIALSTDGTTTNYLLTTEVKLLSSQIHYFYDQYSDNLAYLKVKEYKNTIPVDYESLPSGSIIYNISSVKMVTDIPILTFESDSNPYFYRITLPEFIGKNNLKIRPDSTYVTYSTEYYGQYLTSDIAKLKIGQTLPDIFSKIPKKLMSSFILNQDVKTSTGRNLQTFQLVQSSLTNKDLEHFDNTIQMLMLNLSSGSVTYSAYNTRNFNNTITPLISGTIDSYIGLSYISEGASNDIANRETISIPTVKKTWQLKHPPHNYTLKASYISGSQLYETANLNFYLSSGVSDRFLSKNQIQPLPITDVNYNPLTTAVSSYSAFKIKTELISDFKFMSLPLSTYGKGDLISFSCYDLDDTYISALSCFYGPNFNLYYDIQNSPYVPAVSAQEILITYPKERYGQINVNLKSSLSTINTTIDSNELLTLCFSENKVNQVLGYPVFIEKLNEEENKIIVSCASLSSTSELPCKDLTDSFIRWSYEPSSLSSVVLASVEYDTFNSQLTTINTQRFPYIVPKDTLIPFNNLTNTLMVSGYGNNLITIKLESIKYDEEDTITNSPLYFDFFKDNTFIIDNSNFKNEDKTTLFSVYSKLSYGDQIFDIPESTPIYWKWSYNGNTNPLTQPITAYKTNGSVYEYGTVLDSQDIQNLTFRVYLEDNNNSFDTNSLVINLYSNYRDRIIQGEKTLLLNDYPDKSIFNVDFKTVYYTHSSIQIGDTYDNINTITRPKEDTNKFIFIPNNTVINSISAESISWIVSSDTGLLSTINYDKSNLIYFTEYNSNKTTITLSAHKAIIPGWDIPNNISSTTTIYTINSSEFINPLNFLIYPPYTWLQNSSGYLTLLDNLNYTLAYAPTAYEGKKSLSQDFYVSANKSFDVYDYYYGTISSYITTLNNISGSIDIPYNTEIFSDVGTPISLTAYNEKYPKLNGITYKGVKNNTLYEGKFQITSNTLPFSSTYLNTTSSFLQSPKIVPYDNLFLNFYSNITSIDLEDNIFITINQSLFPLNTSTSPVRGAQEFFNGSISYILSCKYWETSIDVAAIDGVYDLFLLRVGDPSIPLNIRDSEITTFQLLASSVSPITIPDTTFQNVSNFYSGNYDLWSDINKQLTVSEPITLFAYNTSVKPKIFVSSYYTITGESIYFQFETPENPFNYKITSYDVFFGDGLSAVVYDDFLFYKNYISEGIYKISYNVYYNDGTSNFFESDISINVYKNWLSYDQNKIRLLNETILFFGNSAEDTYNLDEINIQPNEWGDADIFNTAIRRLQLNLDYLIYNSQTINTDSPTLFYGWLGANIEEKAYGIGWNTQDYNKEYVNKLENAISFENEDETIKNKYSSFKNITDAVETEERYYVIDGTNFRAFSSGKIPQEIVFENIKEINSLMITPKSIDADHNGENVYISDTFKNKIYKLNIDFESYPPVINLQLSVGTLGTKEDNNKFNSPSELLYEKENVFILDYNNKCVKQYTRDLNWMFTYYSEEFENDQPINIAVHPDNLLVYVLTQNYKIYVFDYFKSEVFEIIDISDINDGNNLVKLFFDESGDFIYILNQKNIYKYSSSGTFISQVLLPNDENLVYSSGKSSFYRSVILCSKHSILKFQDVLSIFRIGQGLSHKYWTTDQLELSNDEFADDLSYNRSINRLVQNIKSFRDTLESRFVIVTEKTDAGVVQYFSLFPVSYKNRPIFDDKIENEEIGIAVNEFHIPGVFNREFKKIYDALLTLKDFLDIKDVRLLNNKVDNIDTGCNGPFCWSWKAMSCYNLSLPVIRICNINPITYAELQDDFPKDYSYVPEGKNKYQDAISKCCSDIKSPLS
jgi:hypothetical protein